jgi:hypothetical protein
MVQELNQKLIPYTDGSFAIARARRAESTALADWGRVLSIYTDLLVKGKIPHRRMVTGHISEAKSLPRFGERYFTSSLATRRSQERDCRAGLRCAGVPMRSARRTRLDLPLAPPCAYRTPPSLSDAVIEDHSVVDDRKIASRLRHMSCHGADVNFCSC